MVSSVINLSDLDGSQGFAIEGINEGERSGYSVSDAGDVNGDGIADIVIGAPGGYYYDYYGSSGYTSGRAYVVFGGSSVGSDGTLELSALDGSNGFVINEIDEGDRLGFSVSSAGDVNGDGIDDLIVGAPDTDLSGNNYSDEGESYVIFGSNSGFDASIDVETLDGNDGFALAGINEGDNSGRSVSSAGDINGDEIDDLIIGAPYADISGNYNNEGQSYVVFGGNDVGNDGTLELSALDGSNGFIISGIDRYDNAGRSVSNAGDINGDGIDDLIVGAPYAGEYVYYGSDSRGESYVIFGGNDVGNDGTLELSALNGSNGFVISGIDSYDNAGRSVSSAGDVNGDGIDDLIIGAPNADASGNYSYEGQSYVVFGGNDVGNSGSLELSTLDGSNGFAISGVDRFDNAGDSVSSAGDVNGDGIDDLIIGAPFADANGNYSAGESYIVFGSSDGFAANLDLAELDAIAINGINNGDRSGSSVSGAGDVNGDGVADVIIGAPYAGPNGNFNAGESYVVFGVLPLELIGTNGEDILTAGTGDDFISGLGGDDILSGEAGRDEILGGSGDDLITGGDGNDTIRGQAGDDNISGNEGNDSLIGNMGSDDILGGDGDDNINGGSESDRLLGEAGDDTISGGTGSDRILGGDGDDIVRGNANNDTVSGGSGNDFVTGNAGDDIVNGENGDDTVNGGSGNDFVAGNAGNDSVLGNAGADEIVGNDGDDTLLGETGDDTLTGGVGSDRIFAGDGDDLLIGVDPSTSDSNFGTGEQDTLTGGLGSDTFILADTNSIFYDDGNNFSAGDDDLVFITDFNSGEDTIQLQGSADLYDLDFFTSSEGTTNAKLTFNPGVTATAETIAVLEDVGSDLSIDDSAFTFV